MSSVPNRTNLKLARLFYKYDDEKKEKEAAAAAQALPPKARLKPEKKDYEKYAPYNFSWFIDGKVAAMGWPQSVENLNYIADAGVDHLITLSPERVPPILECEKKLKWTEINVKEFGAPSLKQILKFIEICERAEMRKETIGVHCRHGRGRTGTMLACYLVYFKEMAPERAVLTVRVLRPGSCETYEQEKVVCHYHDCLRGTINKPDYRMVEDKLYFDCTMKHMYSDEEPKEIKDGVGDSVQDNGVGNKKVTIKFSETKSKSEKKSKAMIINHKIYF